MPKARVLETVNNAAGVYVRGPGWVEVSSEALKLRPDAFELKPVEMRPLSPTVERGSVKASTAVKAVAKKTR